MTLLNGRYELGAIVGSGGMGAVYRATDTRLGRTVAVKLLRGGPLADDHARARMRSEANLAAAIHHPAVAQVYDYDEDHDSPGTNFIVMQFVEGHTLGELLKREGSLPPDQVMSLVVQVAEGLQSAHEAGVVHRDLKPANIMLTTKGRAVLVDFGIARSSDSEPLTETGSLLGTADYMSPEQAGGRSATYQSDLYSLGVIAHHCLTGTSPFRRESHVATALAHLRDDPPTLEPGIPDPVADLIGTLLEKDPARRPTSAAAVALQAATIGAADRIDLPSTSELPAESVPPALTGSQVAAETISRGRRPRAVFAGVGVLALVLGYVGIERLQSGPEVVPDVVGMSVADATARIKDEDLTARTRLVDVPGQPAGQVVRQSPAAGAPDPEDGSVTLAVASGKVVVPRDKLIGRSYDKASAVLEKLGLEVRRKNVVQATQLGEVVGLDKSGRVTDGSTITLSVAVAPAVTRSPTSSGPAKAPKKPAAKSKGKGKKGKAKKK